MCSAFPDCAAHEPFWRDRAGDQWSLGKLKYVKMLVVSARRERGAKIYPALTDLEGVLSLPRAVSAKRDYYEILSVSRDADPSAIKRAYRKLAMEYHPDRNPGDPTAEEKFKEAAEAFEVLSDPKKRELYNQYGHEGPKGAGFQGFHGVDEIFSQFGDLFGDLFGGGGGFGGRSRNGPVRGDDLKMGLQVEFLEAVHGVQREVTIPRDELCETCNGTGAAKGSTPKTCTTCGGAGQVIHRQGFFTVQTACPDCHGAGQIIEDPCSDCSGSGVQRREVKKSVKIPAGIDNGQTLRIVGEGASGLRGGPRGNLYVVVQVQEDERFERDGADIHSEVSISMFDAALGATRKAAAVDNEECEVEVEIPAGTQPGTVITRRGKGAAVVGSRSKGDHHIHVRVAVPTKLSGEQEEALRELASQFGEQHEKKRSLLDSLFHRS